MKEILNNILEGKFAYDNGFLKFSESRIEITLKAGEDFAGSFRISGKPGFVTEGSVYTSDAGMECLTKEFSGGAEEIGFVFHGKGMEAGDVLKGNFYIVSNQGEYELPFVVMAAAEGASSSLGTVKNLFHFANIAKSSWKEAVKLFYSPKFGTVFSGGDKKYAGLYRGLSLYAGNEHNVEEFLIAIHKKQAVQYIIDEDKICIEAAGGISRQEVLLTKNGWGYPYLRAEATGDFITVDKNVLNDDDFLGNRCHFFYYVNSEKLHGGVNFGKLRFYNGFGECSVLIEVRWKDGAERPDALRREKQETLVRMMAYYGDFRMKKISTREWLQHNYELTDRWLQIDESDPEPKLYRAHLLITEGRVSEAGWTLDQARNAILQSSEFNNAIWCYYLYLSTLLKRDESYVNKIAADVAGVYEKEPDNWRLGWLLLYLSPEYGASYAKKWLFIRQQFERGCNSPVFYIEALLLMRLEPSLFTELGDFEMQVLRYAAKHDLLTDEIVLQLHYVVPRARQFSDALLEILKKSYERKKNTETLQSICTMMIGKNRRGTEDFPWYEAGVAENLRITRLYEYYMYSLDMEKTVRLPKVIYMYFSYHNTLDWERSAYLYASLLQNREELTDLVEKEYFHMQEFVVRMVQEGRINRHLAFLYQQLIVNDVMLAEAGGKLSPLLYSVRAEVEDRRFQKLIVRYPKETEEKTYPLSDGHAFLPLYGSDYTLLSEDNAGNRYILTQEDKWNHADALESSEKRGIKIEKLFTDARLSERAQEMDFETVSLQMYLCDGGMEPVTEQNIRRYEKILSSAEIPAEQKRTFIPGMAQFYYDNDRIEELDGFLERLDPAILDNARRGEIVRFLVIRDKTEKALDWIKTYGVQGTDAKTLLRLSSKLVQRPGQAEDEALLSLCFYAFRYKKSDWATLQYLMDYFQGSTKMLRDIWKEAKGKGLDVHDFSGRILEQMLYTGSFVGEKTDIFRSYIAGETDLSLEKAFVSQCCYDYFVKDKVTQKVVFDDLEKLMRQAEPVQKVCLLAYTRYYAEHKKEVYGGRAQLLQNCLLKLSDEGAALSYFQEYADICPAMKWFDDKTFLENRGRPGRKVTVYYQLEQEENDAYQKAEMKEVYEGVFSHMFVLFFGERLLYYLVEEYEADGGKQKEVIGSGELDCADKGLEKRQGRFWQLNDIAAAHALQDYETLDQMLREYESTDRMQGMLFTLQ